VQYSGVKRAAVVVNPTKISELDQFRQDLTSAMTSQGWAEPLWLETTPEETGAVQARSAAEAGVDLVIAAGGDGTVTACASGVAGSQVPLAILPTGTGNVLALNLGIPLDFHQAVMIGLTGEDMQIDLGTANGRPFVVMAGLGIDASLLQSTSEQAKRRFGYLAYVVATLRHLRDRPIKVAIEADGGPVRRFRATGVITGNVGWLRGGLPLLPQASPDDDLLDLVVLTAHDVVSWLILVAHVLARRDAPKIFRATFRDLTIRTAEDQLWELDGEVIGTTRNLVIAVCDDKVRLRVPTLTESGLSQSGRRTEAGRRDGRRDCQRSSVICCSAIMMV
jgi:YegS/Rv2252/BmrU family lipid kinase